MQNCLSRLIAALVCLVPIAVSGPVGPARADGAKVILVLDASGSMWGRIDGRTKIEVARETVGGIVSSWRADDEIGLIAYGHRRKGDCSDIELLMEPGPLNGDRFSSLVNGLNPKGKTPMTEAVRQAAEALRSSEQKATVILVSDGEETCNADPCAVARELEEAGVDFTVHTVGFDIADPKTRAQLQCLARNTGGMFVTADDAEELEKALRTTVAAARDGTVAAPVDEPAETADPARTLSATAFETDGGTRIETDIAWEVYKAGAGGEAEGDLVESGYDVPWQPAIDPGAYVLRARYGMATVEQPVTIEAGEVAEVSVVMNTGVARIRAYESEDADEPIDGSFTLSNGTEEDTQYGVEAAFVAPAGRWTLAVKHGEVTFQTTVEVEAGKTTELDLVVGAGSVAVNAVLVEGGAPLESDIVFEIFPDGGDMNDPLTYYYDPTSVFTMPPGRYVLRATSGLAKATQAVEIEAGGEASTTIILDAGVLVVRKDPAFSSCELFDAATPESGERVSHGYWYDEEHRTAAPAGDYGVICTREDGSTAEAAVSVSPGQVSDASL